MTAKRPPWTLEELRSRCEVSERGCWIWQGYLNRGYAVAYIREPVRTRLAHRMAWEFANGPIPDEMEVDHTCFVRSCINPSHLQLLTRSENGSNQRPRYASHCKWGHEFTKENTYWYLSAGRVKPDRQCRECHRRHNANWRAQGRKAKTA